MKAPWKNPIILDPLIAVAAVHVILIPFAWHIEGAVSLMPGTLSEYAMKPLIQYLSVVGLIAGLFGGHYRSRCRKSEETLRELLLERENLLRVLAHDLSSSVGSSRTLVSLLNEDGHAVASQDDRESLQSVESSLDNAMSLIDLTRELLALESGKMELTVCPVRLEDLLRECVRLSGPASRAKGVRLRLDLESGCRAGMVESVSLTNCVLGNLVGNAVKFSRDGGEVLLTLRQAGNTLRVDVINQGPPVPGDKAAALFNFTGRTSTPGTAGERGTGFGLPLARRFARLMEGDVLFSQEMNADGSARVCFSVIVPAASDSDLACRCIPIARRCEPDTPSGGPDVH